MLRKILAAAVLLSVPLTVPAQDGSYAAYESTGAAAPDNTKINSWDRAQEQLNAEQQKQGAGGLEITRRIRQSLVKDKSLSSYAHNVKIITKDGKVTLKGPVRSEAERVIVEEKAVLEAGIDNVNNEMDVVPE